MILIEARNVNDALEKGIRALKMFGREEDSRNGPVITAPEPVMTQYERPWERVLFSAARDANPFFHLFESLWMLAGRCDVESVARYAARMKDYSDDGENLHGAYGFRWREWHSFDQLTELIKLLRAEPNTRRAVLGMWSPSGDLVASEGYGGVNSKDIPCNTHAYFRKRGDVLDMTVCARSNDMVWGAYGANAVHFSVLHEFMARAVGLPQGRMYQLSNDFHIYRALPQFEALWSGPLGLPVAYELHPVEPLVRPGELAEDFLEDCDLLVAKHKYHRLDEVLNKFRTGFVRFVAAPLLLAHAAWRAGEGWSAVLDRMPPCDWRTAGRAWLERRKK